MIPLYVRDIAAQAADQQRIRRGRALRRILAAIAIAIPPAIAIVVLVNA
jgi:hypothetical protein